MYGIVYCAINKINKKRYIGQTIRELEERIKEHLSQANRNSEYAIHQAIRKYGEDNFEWTVLDHAHSQIELDEKERYWIKFYDSYRRGGYNMALGGQFNLSDDPEELATMRGGREFYVFDLEGNFIKETISQTEFAKEIGSCVQSVNNCLRNIKNKNQVKGCILIFKDEFSDEVLKGKIDKIQEIKDVYKPFAIFNKEYNLVCVMDNKMKCEKEFGVSRSTIIKHLSNLNEANKGRKYHAYYLENIPQQLKSKIKEVI